MSKERFRITDLGLWSRMALAITVGFAVLFLAFTLLGERALQDDTDRLQDVRLVIAQMAAGQVDDLFERAFFALEELAREAALVPGSSILSATAAKMEVEDELAKLSPGLVLIDTSGRVVASRPSALHAVGSDMSELPQIAQALDSPRAMLSEPFLDPNDGQPSVAVIVPLFENGRLQGQLIDVISLQEEAITTPLARATALGLSEHAALVDAQGRVIVSTFDLALLSPGEHSEFYRRAMAGGVPVVETVPFEFDLPGEPLGHLHVMALAPMSTVPWGLTVGGDRADIFAGVQRLRQGLVIIGISALAAVWIATLLGTRRLVRPVQQLTRAADEIAAGNLDVRLHAPEGGEIEIMSAALDRMRNQLLAQIRELGEWNETLKERVAEQTEDLRRQQDLTQQLLRELIHAQESERSRLARELHDEIGQTLTAVELSLADLSNALPAENKAGRRRIERSRKLIESTVAELRTIITALRPALLDQLGLLPSLSWVANQTLPAAGISVSVEGDGIDHRLPAEVETTLFRIAQEAISNVARHSQATSLTIRLLADSSEATMTIADNGQGFVVTPPNGSRAQMQRLGIASMQERAALVDGRLDIISAPGEGTEVRVTIPLRSEAHGEYHVEKTD